MDYKNGMEPLNDEQLESVAGGVSVDDFHVIQAEIMAKADGRLIPFDKKDAAAALQVCSCDPEYKWARSDTVFSVRFPKPQKGYADIKCYRCGKTSSGVIIK